MRASTILLKKKNHGSGQSQLNPRLLKDIMFEMEKSRPLLNSTKDISLVLGFIIAE